MPLIASTIKTYDKFAKLMEKLEIVPSVLTRLTIGSVFITSGWGKLHNLDKVIDFFGSLHIPFPQYQAPFAAGAELVCGIGVLLGLFTRLSTIQLIIIMVVAIITAKSGDLHASSQPLALFDDLTGLTEFLYIVLLLWLLKRGPGVLSLDRILVAIRPSGGGKGEGAKPKAKKD